MKPDYRATVHACFVGYVVQAVVNNFAPLLFLTFQSSYQIPLAKITMLITFNFSLQLVVDLLSAGFIDRIGYRVSTLVAHVLSAAGLVALAVLPGLLPDPFTGLLVAVMIYAVGGGLLEVLISPMVQACPTENKEKTMSLLHSFYCWGYVGVVLVSTLFFYFFGIRNWRVLACLWALIPVANAVVFLRVPIAPLIEDGGRGLTVKELARRRVFWALLLLMFCAGASEQAVSQWASTFAQEGLGVGKTIGDLTGPMFFAVMMGAVRLINGKRKGRTDLGRLIVGSAVLCIGSYLMISLPRIPVFSLVGCGLCGFSVGIMWPGTVSMASEAIRGGGTAMFAFLALAGDLGCSAGPTFVGLVSSAGGDNLKIGILAGTVFPVLLLLGSLWKRKMPAAPAAQNSP